MELKNAISIGIITEARRGLLRQATHQMSKTGIGRSVVKNIRKIGHGTVIGRKALSMTGGKAIRRLAASTGKTGVSSYGTPLNKVKGFMVRGEMPNWMKDLQAGTYNKEDYRSGRKTNY